MYCCAASLLRSVIVAQRNMTMPPVRPQARELAHPLSEAATPVPMLQPYVGLTSRCVELHRERTER